MVMVHEYSPSVVNRYLAIYVVVCVGEKKWQNKDGLQLFCSKTVLCYQLVILLNLEEYRLILANSAYGLVGDIPRDFVG